MYRLLHNFVEHNFDKQYDRLVDINLSLVEAKDDDKKLLLSRHMELNRIRVQSTINGLLEETKDSLASIERYNTAVQDYVNQCLDKFENMNSQWTDEANCIFYEVEKVINFKFIKFFSSDIIWCIFCFTQAFREPRAEPNIHPTDSPLSKIIAEYRQMDVVNVYTRVLIENNVLAESQTAIPHALHDERNDKLIDAIKSKIYYQKPTKPRIDLESEQKHVGLFRPESIIVNIRVIGTYSKDLPKILLSTVMRHFLLDPITYVIAQYNLLVNEFLRLMKEKNLVIDEVKAHIKKLEDIKFRMQKAIMIIRVEGRSIKERAKRSPTTELYLKALDDEYSNTIKWDEHLPAIFTKIEQVRT